MSVNEIIVHKKYSVHGRSSVNGCYFIFVLGVEIYCFCYQGSS